MNIILQKFRNAEISTKITVTYTACFILLLMIINAVMYFGVFYALYRPASRSIKFSMENVKNLMENIAQDTHAFQVGSIHEPLVAGVVLRVIDDAGNILIDSDAHYLSNEDFNKNILEDPPIFANEDMEVAEFKGALVYRAKTDFTFEGEHVNLYFFRTITSEKFLLDNLESMLLLLDLFGIIFAVAVGHFTSRKVLKPIETMTEHAQNIAFGKMNGRIEIPPANDELTELAKTFNDMLDRIQGGIDAQLDFVVKATHALLNPAAAIFGSNETLKRHGFNDKKIFDEMTDAISYSVDNMDDILKNLLFITRIDRNCQKINKVKLNSAQLVKRAAELKKIVAPNYNFEIIQNDDAEIFGDEDLILQMLERFLDNAVKYNPENKKITVSSKVDGGKIFVSIADNGVGIAREYLDKIFERFFRIGTVEDVRGSGLGLSIAKWIADNHDIKIEVASELGRGTTFTLVIPTV